MPTHSIFGQTGPVIAVLALFPVPALAEQNECNGCSDAPRWKISLGIHLAERIADLHYERKNDSANRSNDIGDRPLPFNLRAFAHAGIEYAINDRSAIEFDYSGSSIEETGVVRRTTRFLFVPLQLAVRTPISLKTESLKLRYAFTVYHRQNLAIAITVGIRDFRASASYRVSGPGEQTDSYQAYLPTVGAHAGYRWSENLSLIARADFMPIRTRYNDGSIGDLALAAEYRTAFGALAGLGYQYSHISLHSDRNNSWGQLNYVAHGPLAYLAIRF